MRHVSVTIRYSNGEEQTAVIDKGPSGARLREDEGWSVIRFGRTEDGEWHELIAAPAASVRSWD
jgi:hypothetical protein